MTGRKWALVLRRATARSESRIFPVNWTMKTSDPILEAMESMSDVFPVPGGPQSRTLSLCGTPNERCRSLIASEVMKSTTSAASASASGVRNTVDGRRGAASQSLSQYPES